MLDKLLRGQHREHEINVEVSGRYTGSRYVRATK
jgi:hypothetical protein